MIDDLLRRRIYEAVTGPPDPERDIALEGELAESPEALAEYSRLKAIWRDLKDLPADEPPMDAREAARKAVLAAAGRLARPRMRLLANVAAGVLLFLGGTGLGAWLTTSGGPATDPADDQPAYVLFIRGGDLPGSERDAAAEMGRWAGDLAESRRLEAAGRLLRSEAVWVGEKPASRNDASPIGGFFLVRARDLSQAVAMARQSPHLRWGGVVEVVPVAPGP